MDLDFTCDRSASSTIPLESCETLGFTEAIRFGRYALKAPATTLPYEAPEQIHHVALGCGIYYTRNAQS